MKRFGCVPTIGVLAAATAAAQLLDPEVTMRPITDPAVELPAPVTELLALPDAASAIAEQRSADGLARANERRGENRRRLGEADDGIAIGLQVAEEARERGAELGAQVAEAARNLRENLVRGADRSDLPIPLDLPMPDDVPGRGEGPRGAN